MDSKTPRDEMKSDLCKSCIHTSVCAKTKNVFGDVFVMGHPSFFDNGELLRMFEERKADGFPCEDYLCKDGPMTNAEKVRAMSDEELAEVIKHPCDIGNHIPTEWCASRHCGYQCSLDWLREEAK